MSDNLDGLVGDSDAALQRLCAAVARRTPDLDSPILDDVPGADRDGAAHFFAAPAAGPSASILDAISALRIAVVGAADLANARTRAIVATLPDDADNDRLPDPGALFRRGEETLRRLIGDLLD